MKPKKMFLIVGLDEVPILNGYGDETLIPLKGLIQPNTLQKKIAISLSMAVKSKQFC